MYRMKLGVPVKAVQFTGLNFMEIFSLIPRAFAFYAKPNASVEVSYWDKERGNSTLSYPKILNTEVFLNQWLVIDDAGPIVVDDDLFKIRYERIPDADR